jgi:lipopolysaccharide export system protein LptA
MLAGLLALVAGPVAAEKADRDKPVNIEADRMLVDDARKESVFEGNVVLTQGTLQLKGDRVVVRQDPGGFQHGIAYGRPAGFRQKRDGYDEYIEGRADRIEYDGRRDLLQMFGTANLMKGQDEVRGEYISYNAKTEFFQVTAGEQAPGAGTSAGGRVRAVIQPKARQEARSGDPATLRPSAPPER